MRASSCGLSSLRVSVHRKQSLCLRGIVVDSHVSLSTNFWQVPAGTIALQHPGVTWMKTIHLIRRLRSNILDRRVALTFDWSMSFRFKNLSYWLLEVS